MTPHKWLMPSEWVKLGLILLFFFCGIFPALWFYVSGDLPTFWLREDGLYESCAALACLFGSIASFIAFYYSNDNGLTKRNLWLFLYALAFLSLAGEEISWGQRIFDLEISAKALQSNFQNEFNLHNARFIQSRNNVFSEIFTQLLVAYLIVLPVGLAIFPSIHKIFIKIRFPVPNLLLTFIVLSIKVANIICCKVLTNNNYVANIGESFESLLEICLVLVVVDILLKQLKNRTSW